MEMVDKSMAWVLLGGNALLVKDQRFEELNYFICSKIVINFF